MTDVNILLTCLQPLLTRSTYRPLQLISEALLMMTGRITMLGISRWTEKGGSYRTLQRFFSKELDWCAINWAIMLSSWRETSDVILIAGDATTVSKSGKTTFGLGKFFSSTYTRALCTGH